VKRRLPGDGAAKGPPPSGLQAPSPTPSAKSFRLVLMRTYRRRSESLPQSREQSAGDSLIESLAETLPGPSASGVEGTKALMNIPPDLGGKIRRSSLLPSDPCPLLGDSSS
jgi:hypothetical protein